MSDTMTITHAAQLREADNQIAYFRSRVAVLAQHIMDRDVLIAEQERRAELRDVDLKSEIAGLQDELRQARQRSVVIEEVADAE